MAKISINFYEEFPNQENLKKLELVDFPVKLVLAAPNLKRFSQLKKKLLSNRYVKEIIYWPILSKEEGYWMSSFSKREALQRIINELKENKENLTVMWDAELPTLTKSLFYTQLFNLLKNRKLISNFFKNSSKYGLKVITSEYPLEKNHFKFLLNLFSVKFSKKLNYDKIDMAYTSLMKFKDKEGFIKKHMGYGRKCFGKRFKLGLGVIYPGILGDEPRLTPEELDRDLSIAENLQIEEIYIFRLGGLNKQYIDVLKKYI